MPSTTTSSFSQPSTPNPLPRPLQLVDGNVPPSQVTSPTSSLPSSSRPTFPSPLSASITSPTWGSTSSPRAPNARRQSSISYFPSNHTRPSPEIRSPLSPPAAFAAKSSRRSNSLYIKSGEPIGPLLKKGNRRSVGFENTSTDSKDDGSTPPDHGPLTLTEKHADLLRFIAQKESKCLELRSQLAVHEAELAQLKRKWERIVSRGMDRAYTSTSPSTHPPSSSLSSSALPSPLTLAAGNTAVLDGIKEGVGRLIAAGLDLSSPSPPTSATSQVGGGSTNGVTRVTMAPSLRNAKHGNTQSISSVSTVGTTSTNTSASMRLSQSSASSSMSLLEDDELCEEPEEEDQDRDVTTRLDLQSRMAAAIAAASETKPRTSQDGVIAVDISISPSSETNSSKLVRRRSHECPKLPPSPIEPTSMIPSSQQSCSNSATTRSTTRTEPPSKRMSMTLKRAVTSGGGSMAPASSVPGLGPLNVNVQPVSSWMGSVGSSMNKKWEEIQKGETFTKSQKRASVLISDVFAALASPSTPHNLSSTTSTPGLTPHTSSPTVSSRARHQPSKSKSAAGISISTNPFLPEFSSLSPAPSTPSPLSTSASVVSLLDEDVDEEDEFGDFTTSPAVRSAAVKTVGSGGGKGLGAVLVPTPLVKKSEEEEKRKSTISIDDDDDWNW